ERRFSVCTAAVKQEDAMFASVGGQCIPYRALRVPDEVCVASENLCEELSPARRLDAGVVHDGRELGVVVPRPMGTKLTSLEVQNSVQHVQRPWVRIEQVWAGSEFGVG